MEVRGAPLGEQGDRRGEVHEDEDVDVDVPLYTRTLIRIPLPCWVPAQGGGGSTGSGTGAEGTTNEHAAEMHEEEGGERSPATLAGATVAPSVSNGVADPARYLPPHRGYSAARRRRRDAGSGQGCSSFIISTL